MSAESLDNMIKSVVRLFKWTPDTIEKLFYDDIDFEGLVFWYNDTEVYQNEIKETSTKSK